MNLLVKCSIERRAFPNCGMGGGGEGEWAASFFEHLELVKLNKI